MIIFASNPLNDVIESAQPLLAGKDVRIQFDEIEDDALGNTEFDADNPHRCIVTLSIHLPIIGACDILTHELAHVLAGPDAEHGPEWQAKYDWIYDNYNSYIEAMSSEGVIKTVDIKKAT